MRPNLAHLVALPQLVQLGAGIRDAIPHADALDSGLVEAGDCSTGVDVLSGSGRMFAWEQLHTPIPDVSPALSRAVSEERMVDPITKDDLATAEVLVKGCAYARVPVVEIDGGPYVAASRLEVRPEPAQREAIGDDLVVDA